MKTKNYKSGSTNYFNKSITVLTEQGREVLLTITRRVINVTSEPFVSSYTYELQYGDSYSGGFAPVDKEDLKMSLGIIDTYSKLLKNKV